MKSRVLVLALIVFQVLTLPICARTADMEKVAERYIRDLLRKVPELAGTQSTRDARETILANYKRLDILALSADQRRTIEDREPPVSDDNYQATLLKLKEAIHQTNETKFLLELAGEEKIEGEEKLLLFRLMEQHTEIDSAKRENTLKSLLDASRAYKEQNSKYAATLADLNLAQDIAKFTDKTGATHDWLYLGGTSKGISRKSSRVIFVEPIANASGDALAINSRASRFPVNLEEVKAEVAALASESTTKSSPNQEPVAPTAESNEYSLSIKRQMKDIMLAYLAHSLKNKSAPTSLAEMNLPTHLAKSTSPNGKSAKNWIFVPVSKNIKIHEANVILVSPYLHDEKHHYVATDDGKINSITPADFDNILKRLKK